MPNSKLRRQIAWEAARLLYERQETEFLRAKLKAARKLCQGWAKPADLPGNAEIRDQLQMLAHLYEGDRRTDNLEKMRIAALGLMRRLSLFRPRLIGSVLTGHIRQGSDIDLHLFSNTVEAVTHVLDQEGVVYEVERKEVRKHGAQRTFHHVHIAGEFAFELTIYAANQAHYVFKSSITSKAIERASVAQLEQLLTQQYPQLDLESALAETAAQVDRFQVYESLLLPLDNVRQNLKFHPEGDALYHSLQVFNHAREESPYDEEFLTAALLHDVGKGIDNYDHVTAGLAALADTISERTAWLIEHHMLAHDIANQTIGRRAHRRLRESESYEDLVTLGECDRAGRQAGVDVPELDEALDYLRELGQMFG